MTTPSDNTLPYLTPSRTRISRLAKISFALSLFAALSFFFVIPSIVCLILCAIANERINKSPKILAGKGYAVAGIALNLCSFLVGVAALVLMSGGCRPRELSNRSYCAANARGIMQSMNVYAADNNDRFPLVSFATYSPALNAPTATASTPTTMATISNYYTSAPAQPGSIPASLWILVLNNRVTPKQFICKSDPFVSDTAAQLTDARNNFYNNFQGNQLSYSFAYPWKADGTPGKWWTATTDSSLPIMSDIAPEQGTGTPAKILNPSAAPLDNRSWNSDNHQGQGQTVAYSDGHAIWSFRPDVGYPDDNIFTTSGYPSTRPTQFNGLPATKSSPALTSDAPPYDIIMYPIRNASTGSL